LGRLGEVDAVGLREPADQRTLQPLGVGPRCAVHDPADQRLRQQVLHEHERVRHLQSDSPGPAGATISGGRRRYQPRIFKKSAAIVAGTCGALDSATHSARGPIMNTTPECTTLYCSPSCSCFSTPTPNAFRSGSSCSSGAV